MSTSRFLVSGCAGFIGARVCEMLLDAGADVLGIDDLNDAYDVRLKRWRLSGLEGRQGFTFKLLDIRDASAVEALFASAFAEGRRFDAVVNLAARAGIRGSVAQPALYYNTNVLGTVHLLEGCRASGVRRFVLASSSSVYGADAPVPHREDQPLGTPLSPYAASKRAAEELCETYSRLHGIRSVALRFFSVYGPAGRPDMSPFRFTRWIAEGQPVVLFGDGSQSRDFTYIDDIARGTVAALGVDAAHVVNLGSDRPVSLLELIATLESLLGRKAILERHPANDADARTTWADVATAKRTLAWQPATTLDQGLSKLVEWYLANRSWLCDLES